MKKKIIFLLLMILILVRKGSGQNEFQKGFVLTNKNELVRGYVRLFSGATTTFTCYFKENESGSELKLSPNEILSYGYDSGRVYFSKKILIDKDNADVFAEMLISGSANLYTCLGRYFIENSSIFLEIKNEKKSGKENKKYLGILNYVLSDCKEIKGYISDYRNSNVSWIEIVKKAVELHNTCKPPRKLELHILPALGINVYSINFIEVQNSSLKFYSQSFKNYQPLFVGCDLEFLKRKSRLALQIGGSYLSSKYGFSNFYFGEYNEFSLSNSLLAINAGPRFVFFRNGYTQVSVNLKAGILQSMSLSNLRTREILSGNSIYTEETVLKENGKIVTCYSAGVTINRNVRGLVLVGNINYSVASSSMLVADTDFSMKRVLSGFNFSVGVKF